MTTSGTFNFTETRDQIITNALSLLGVVAAGEPVNTNDITLCASLLNQMVKGWMAQGVHLWTEEEGTLFLINGQNQYILSSSGGTQASDGSGTPVETTLATSAASSATTITPTTTVGMSSGDNIGIQLNNNTIQWTTINGAPANGVVTLTAALTSAAASGNQVFTYTTVCPKPLSIHGARLRNSNGFDRTVKIEPRQVYDMIPQKSLTGSPIILMYSPQLSNGIVYLWPTPNDVSSRIEFTYLRTIQDFDASSDNPDLPQEWLECLAYNLAVRAAPAYGINLASGGIGGNPDILRMAAEFLDELKAWDCEQPYTKIIPGYRF
jgi:hypothetical protein